MGVIMPTVQKAGIDPLWFGIFIVIVVEMAQVTPPVGFNLFVLQGMTKREIGTIARAAFPVLPADGADGRPALRRSAAGSPSSPSR
jgi:TRAP-type C4-dicarboxylate transport system permease large subunit